MYVYMYLKLHCTEVIANNYPLTRMRSEAVQPNMHGFLEEYMYIAW